MKTIEKTQAKNFIENTFTNESCIRLYCHYEADKRVRPSVIN
jgi:hypothetical protein